MEELDYRNTALLLKIDHKDPIEVKDFIATISSISKLYHSFCLENGIKKHDSQSRLYVEKVEHGSIEVFLASAWEAVLPTIGATNTILEFAKFIKHIVNYYKGDEAQKPILSYQQMKDLLGMYAVSANNKSAVTSIGAVNIKISGSPTFVDCNFTYQNSNSALNQLNSDMKNERNDEDSPKVICSQLMTIKVHHAKHESRSSQGIIEDIDSKPHFLIFEDSTIENSILHEHHNPTKKIFVVDVIPMHANGRIGAYKVIALHDILDSDF